MDVSNLTLFKMQKKRMDWISARQEVLSQNIANADTPGYVAKQITPFDFKTLLQREKNHVKVDATHDSHIGQRDARVRDYAEERNRKLYETAPAGNEITLEQQVMKMNETQTDHNLTTTLYKKNIALFKLALGRG